MANLFEECQAESWRLKLSTRSITPELNLGIPLLDLGSGGIAASNRIIIQGASESGKTTLATTLAHHLEKQDCSVMMLAHDQHPVAVWARLTQLEGSTRGEFIKDPECLLNYKNKQIAVAGPEVLLENAIETLKSRHTKYKVLIVDSLQTCSSIMHSNDRRVQVDNILNTVSEAAALGIITISISTLSRAGARGLVGAEHAAKESGDIIHHADLLLDIRKVSQAVARLSIVKNRLGLLHGADSSRFYASCDLSLDPETSEAREISGGLIHAKKQSLRVKILESLDQPKLQRDICSSITGRTKTINDEIGLMLAEGLLVNVEGKISLNPISKG